MSPHPRILLTGATSVLGFAIARAAPGEVEPLGNPHNRSSIELGFAPWLAEQVCPSIDTAEIVIYAHAVCDVGKCERDPEWADQVNVEPVRSLLDRLPPRVRFVYVSSDHVFGEDGRYDERSEPCPISVYGASRVAAEELVRARPGSLIVRVGLAIGASPDGRTGHQDWLRYRTARGFPITIVADEARSAVWASDAAVRVLDLAASEEAGVRHVTATRCVSRPDLATHLLDRAGLPRQFETQQRAQRPAPHLGRIELATVYDDDLAQELPSVVDGHP